MKPFPHPYLRPCSAYVLSIRKSTSSCSATLRAMALLLCFLTPVVLRLMGMGRDDLVDRIDILLQSSSSSSSPPAFFITLLGIDGHDGGACTGSCQLWAWCPSYRWPTAVTAHGLKSAMNGGHVNGPPKVSDSRGVNECWGDKQMRQPPDLGQTFTSSFRGGLKRRLVLVAVGTSSRGVPGLPLLPLRRAIDFLTAEGESKTKGLASSSVSNRVGRLVICPRAGRLVLWLLLLVVVVLMLVLVLSWQGVWPLSLRERTSSYHRS